MAEWIINSLVEAACLMIRDLGRFQARFGTARISRVPKVSEETAKVGKEKPVERLKKIVTRSLNSLPVLVNELKGDGGIELGVQQD